MERKKYINNKSALIVVMVIVFVFLYLYVFDDTDIVQERIEPVRSNVDTKLVVDDVIEQGIGSMISNDTMFAPPLSDHNKRILLKPFGLYIDRENSPVQNERFAGYHTGTDFEVFPDELETSVPIFAICSGKIIRSGWVKGYGGVVVQSCTVENRLLHVLYGHVSLEDTKKSLGERLEKGEMFSILGKNKSTQTDGERKHLHLGIYTGSSLDLRGYVQHSQELGQWLDFEEKSN